MYSQELALLCLHYPVMRVVILGYEPIPIEHSMVQNYVELVQPQSIQSLSVAGL